MEVPPVDAESFRQSFLSRPHVVLLGAGASRAALPDGDAIGRRLPLMIDFIEVLQLEGLLDRMGVDYSGMNFETLYASLVGVGDPGTRQLEEAIEKYFDSLRLPDYPTIYDYLVLSVRDGDMIATFNWDPFLIQALRRNAGHIDTPRLAYLHGGAWWGFCPRDKVMGVRRTRCPRCGELFEPSRLLYPIAQKDYSSDELISAQWDEFRHFLRIATFFTVFGYGRPESDVEAISAIEKAWGTPAQRQFEEIEIIDVRREPELRKSWDGLIHSHHYEVHPDYFTSWLGRHPRRAIDMYVAQFLDAQFIDDNPAPRDVGFDELWVWFDDLRAAES